MKTLNILAAAAAIAMASIDAMAANEVTTYPVLGSDASVAGIRYAYVYINDNATVKPTRIYLERYTDAGTLTPDSETLLTDAMIVDNIYRVPVSTADHAFRVRLEYDTTTSSTDSSGTATTTTTTSKSYGYYSDNGLDYVYGSDFPSSSYKWSVGYGGKLYVDKAQDNAILNLANTVYYKGFGIHATGYIYFTITAGLYNRFVSNCGIQTNQTLGKVNYTLTLNSTVANTQNDITSVNPILWDYPLDSSINTVKVDINMGTDNSYDHSSLCGLRFYLTTNNKRAAQTITCDQPTYQRVNVYNNSVTLPISASASSGLTPYMRIASGTDMAKFDGNGNIVFNPHSSGKVIVEIAQPGNLQWQTAPLVTVTYDVRDCPEVKPGETLALKDGQKLDEVIVYNDGLTSGQVTTSGLVQVGTLTYKLTMYPNAPALISFPSDMDIDKVSNLKDLGFTLNTVDQNSGYTLKAYNTERRAEQEDYVDKSAESAEKDSAAKRAAARRITNNTPTADASYWRTCHSSHVDGDRGYMLILNKPGSTDPIEVTFTLNNSALDLNNGFDGVNMTFDLSTVSTGTVKTVYISPKGVQGNTLKVQMTFAPEDSSNLPLNFQNALNNARVTYTADRRGIRLTLPTSQPAKLAIYDKTGTKLYKAVRYVSPFLIDVSDLPAGEYKMYISYGNAVDTKMFTLPRH